MRKIIFMSKGQKVNKLFLFVTISLLVAATGGLNAEATVIELKAPAETARGEQFLVELYLDPEGQAINAIEGEINIIGRNFEITGFEEKNSIISLWILRPTATGGVINFAGAILGGFAGVLEPGKAASSAGKIFGILFQAKESGPISIAAGLSKVTLHDGLGTLIEVVGVNKLVSVEADVLSSGDFSDSTLLDLEPPEDFTPLVISSRYLYDGKYVLVFQTRDLASGIDHYEVKEGRSDFRSVESPYLLKNQELHGKILVKAVDRTGNERIVRAEIIGRGFSDYVKIMIGVLTLVIVLIGIFLFLRWQRLSHNHYLKRSF